MSTPAHQGEPSSSARRIETDADICDGVRDLRRKCVVFRRLHDQVGDPPLRRREPGFEGLARIIVGQQVSVASADAIWERTWRTVQPFEPSVLLSISVGELRAAGLSQGKIKTLTSIAREIKDSGLDLSRLDGLSDADVRSMLMGFPGVGPWTADVFLLFCLGRADAFAAGDLALQVSAQLALGLKQRPKPDDLLEIAERWRPWRGVAARMLWAYYKVAKKQSSGSPV